MCFAIQERRSPDLLFLGVFVSLVFFSLRNSLVFLTVFCLFQTRPARKVGTRSGQGRPKVPGRFAFPGARNPRICSISRSGKNFIRQFSRDFPGVFPENPRTDPGNSHSLLEFSERERHCLKMCFAIQERRRGPEIHG